MARNKDEPPAAVAPPAGPVGTQRLDKWLWFARVIKTRTQAAALVTEGKVRLNRVKIDRPSQPVRPGDVLTIVLGSRVRILEVRAPGERRGSPADAQAIMKDLTPPPPPRSAEVPLAQGQRDEGSGRPTKRERRDLDRWLDSDK